MAEPFIGEIRMFGGNFAPREWAFCNGQSMSIAEFGTLFNLIGTTYGGDGVTIFNLPDLRGRVPIHQGTSLQGITSVIGQLAGTESVTLTTSQIPSHSHSLEASTNSATSNTPTGQVLAHTSATKLYSALPATAALAPQTIGLSGGSQPHDNMQPFLCVSFIIALVGIFPSQN